MNTKQTTDMNASKLIKNALLILGLVWAGITNAQQGVSISENVEVPHAAAMLEIKSTDKGVLIPKVELEDIEDFEPITQAGGEVDGLLVYNISDELPHGFYYWENNRWNSIVAGNGIRYYSFAEAEALPLGLVIPGTVIFITDATVGSVTTRGMWVSEGYCAGKVKWSKADGTQTNVKFEGGSIVSCN